MIKIMDYYPSQGFQLNEYSIEELRERIKQMPPVHRLSFLMGLDVQVDDYSPFVDIVPGLADYLSKSGIFRGYE